MTLLTISVKGTASIPRTAELAVLSIKISSQGPSQAQISTAATSTASALQAIFRDHSSPDSSSSSSISNQPTTPSSPAAISNWTMSSMTTTSWYPTDTHGVASKEKTHRANLDFSVRVRDTAILGPLAAQLGVMDHVKIDHVAWILTRPTIEAHRSELRKMAAADAAQRARDYAEALGMGIVKPVELVEEGAPGPSPMMQARYAAAAPMGGSLFGRGGGQTGAEEEVTHVVFRPEEIEMSAGVTCKFLVGSREEDFTDAAVLVGMRAAGASM